MQLQRDREYCEGNVTSLGCNKDLLKSFHGGRSVLLTALVMPHAVASYNITTEGNESNKTNT